MRPCEALILTGRARGIRPHLSAPRCLILPRECHTTESSSAGRTIGSIRFHPWPVCAAECSLACIYPLYLFFSYDGAVICFEGMHPAQCYLDIPGQPMSEQSDEHACKPRNTGVRFVSGFISDIWGPFASLCPLALPRRGSRIRKGSLHPRGRTCRLTSEIAMVLMVRNKTPGESCCLCACLTELT